MNRRHVPPSMLGGFRSFSIISPKCVPHFRFKFTCRPLAPLLTSDLYGLLFCVTVHVAVPAFVLFSFRMLFVWESDSIFTGSVKG